MGSVDEDCYTLHSYRNFSCHDYDVTATSKLVEIQGKLVLEDCTNLDRDFVNLKKIVGKGGGIPLIIYSSSAPPTLEFLKRIQFSFIGPPSSVLVRIDSTVRFTNGCSMFICLFSDGNRAIPFYKVYIRKAGPISDASSSMELL